MHLTEVLLLSVGVLLLFSIIASRVSDRLGVPALLLFLLVGMLAGSEGPGGIYFDNAEVAQSLGTLALSFILFSGGLSTEWRAIRSLLGQGALLANVGVVVSALLVAGVSVWALGFSPLEGMLLGAIISSTDAAAVFSVLRVRGVELKHNLEPLIELESGSNDPIAVFLTVGITGLIVTPGSSFAELVPAFLLQMSVGAVMGLGLGWVATRILNRVRLIAEGLYPVLTVAVVLLTYGSTALLGGSGFLAVYLAGITMGNRDFVHKRSLLRFHDGIAWLMQIAMFLTLGLLVFPSQLLPVAGAGVLMALFLTFVARPISVFGALAWSGRSAAQKLMVSWAGLRGAVPIVLATFPLLAGIPQALEIFNLVFFIVLTSVLLQGTTIGPVARWLRLNEEQPSNYRRFPLEFVPQVSTSSELLEVDVLPTSLAVGRTLVDLALPNGALVVLLTRNNHTRVPNGGTVIRSDDKLLLLIERDTIPLVQSRFGGEMKQGA